MTVKCDWKTYKNYSYAAYTWRGAITYSVTIGNRSFEYKNESAAKRLISLKMTTHPWLMYY